MGQAVDTAFGNTADFIQRHAALLGNDMGQFSNFSTWHGQIMHNRDRIVFLGDVKFGDGTPRATNGDKWFSRPFMEPVNTIKMGFDFGFKPGAVTVKDRMQTHSAQRTADAFLDFALLEQNQFP